MAARLRGVRSGPSLALAGVVVGAAILYGSLTRLVNGPHVFGDELFYSDAADSLAHGDGLLVRGEHYGYGPVYPALLALVRLTVSNQPSAHWLWLLANSIFVALAAVPAYFLARRLLGTWWSVAVAALAVCVPSAFYAAAVMTDCLGYLAAVTGLLAITLAVERPTVRRQLVVLATVAVAAGVRAQYALLFATFVIALGLRWVLIPSPLGPVRRRLRQLWPTLAVTVSGVLVLAAVAAAGRSLSSLLGPYSGLAQGYPLAAIVRWTIWHVFDLALYLGLVGAVAVPFALALLYRDARAGSPRDASLLATFVAANAVGLVLVGVFSTSQFGLERLHDRYLFYVIPLWLVALATWVSRGAPRSRWAALVVAVAFVAFVLAMPYARLVVPDSAKMFDGTGTAVFARLQEFAGQTHGLTGRRGLALGAALAGAWIVLTPRRYAWTALAIVAVFFVAGGAIMWDRTIKDSWKGVFPDRRVSTRGWVDAAVPSTADVTILTAIGSGCSTRVDRYASLFTEFFNARIRRVPYVGAPLEVGPPTHRLHVAGAGMLVTAAGAPFRATYIVVPRGIRIQGRKLATGTNARLALWKTTGTVRFPGARSDAALLREACT